MSARGLKSLDDWMAEQLPIVARGDQIAVSDLADQLMTAAEKAGIPADEINGEVASVRSDPRGGASSQWHPVDLFLLQQETFRWP